MINILRTTFPRWHLRIAQFRSGQIVWPLIFVGFSVLCVKFIALVKEQVVASQFGTSDVYEAFLMAFMLPSLVSSIISGGIYAAVMPTYVEVAEREGSALAQKLADNVMALVLLFLLGASLLLTLLAPLAFTILGSSFNQEKLSLTKTLFFLLLPILPVTCLTSLWGTFLNSRRNFLIVSLVPVLTSLIIIVSLLSYRDPINPYLLTAATLGGAVVEALAMALAIRRKGLAISLRWHGFDGHTKNVVHQFKSMVAGTFLLGATGPVDQIMAATLESGSLAALNYGSRIINAGLSIGVTTLGTVVFPYFSALEARAERKQLVMFVASYSKKLFWLSLLGSLMIWYFSEAIVRLVFERGAFTAADTTVVASVQAMASIQIPFYLVGTLIVRAISAVKRNDILLISAALSLPIDVLLNYAFMKVMGVAGIALSTSLVYLGSSLFTYLMLKKALREFP
ncbi:MAG: putative lipid II flippase MurJ [Nitrospira sp.]